MKRVKYSIKSIIIRGFILIGKKSEAKGISVKIKTEEEIEGFKKIVQKSDEEIAKSVSRLIAIDQRQSEFDDRKLNKYFITIQKKL